MSFPMLGAAYYPEDWPESEQDRDIAAMVNAGISLVRMGEFAWHKMEPREGAYDFSWLHRVMEKLDAAGIRVILGTPSAAPPIWLEELDPEMRVLCESGLQRQHGGRRHCCSNNPTFRSHAVKIAQAMGQEFGQDPRVVGWQIDNEISPYYRCQCSHCRKGFADYLRMRYGTIENLNARWNLSLFSQAYTSFSQVPMPRSNTWHNPHLKLEWTQFHALSNQNFIQAQAEALRPLTNAPIGTDMMPVFDQDHGEMNAFLDVVQYNHYNDEANLKQELFWFDYMRGIKDRPFWVTETSPSWNGGTVTPANFRAEGFCRANSWLPIVLGAEMNLYWLWRQHWAGHELMHGAVLYASGRPMHTLGEIQDVAAGYQKCAEFLQATRVKTDFALMASSLSNCIMSQQEIVPEPDLGQSGTAYSRRMARLYEAVAKAGIRPDVLPAGNPLDTYKILFTPLLLTLEQGDLPQRIEAFVRQGGLWVAGPMADLRDDIGAHYINRETGILERLTGATLCHQLPDTAHRLQCAWADGTPFHAGSWIQAFDPPSEAQVLARVTGGYSALKGKAIAFLVRIGRGAILVLGTEPDTDDAVNLLTWACREFGSNHPKIHGQVAAAFREGPDISGIAAQEYGGNPAAILLDGQYIDLLTGKTWTGEMPLAPYQTAILQKIDT